MPLQRFFPNFETGFRQRGDSVQHKQHSADCGANSDQLRHEFIPLGVRRPWLQVPTAVRVLDLWRQSMPSLCLSQGGRAAGLVVIPAIFPRRPNFETGFGQRGDFIEHRQNSADHRADTKKVRHEFHPLGVTCPWLQVPTAVRVLDLWRRTALSLCLSQGGRAADLVAIPAIFPQSPKFETGFSQRGNSIKRRQHDADHRADMKKVRHELLPLGVTCPWLQLPTAVRVLDLWRRTALSLCLSQGGRAAGLVAIPAMVPQSPACAASALPNGNRLSERG